MTLLEAEPKIMDLMSVWRNQLPQLSLLNGQLHCWDFIDWIRLHNEAVLDFPSLVLVTDLIEMWFNREYAQA